MLHAMHKLNWAPKLTLTLGLVWCECHTVFASCSPNVLCALCEPWIKANLLYAACGAGPGTHCMWHRGLIGVYAAYGSLLDLLHVLTLGSVQTGPQTTLMHQSQHSAWLVQVLHATCSLCQLQV